MTSPGPAERVGSESPSQASLTPDFDRGLSRVQTRNFFLPGEAAGNQRDGFDEVKRCCYRPVHHLL